MELSNKKFTRYENKQMITYYTFFLFVFDNYQHQCRISMDKFESGGH